MDIERTIDDIEQLEEMFEAPDNRPLSKQTSLVVGNPDRTEADAQGWGYFNS
jgi:hypothetical protein